MSAFSSRVLLRQTLHQNRFHLNHQYRFCRFHHRPTNIWAYRSINNTKRGFTTKKSNGIPGKPKTNYMIRIIFVVSIIGFSFAFYNGWTFSDKLPENLSNSLPSFSIFNSENKEKEGKKPRPGVYKLPKPKKKEKAEKTSKPKPTPKKKPKPSSPPTFESKPKPKPKIESKPKPKPLPKPKPKSSELKQKPSSSSLDKKMAQTLLLEQYETIQEELKKIGIEMDNKSDTKSNESQSDNKLELELKLNLNKIDEYKKQILDLNKQIFEQSLIVEKLENELNVQSEFLEENIIKLEEGRNAYDEVTNIFSEMTEEFQEQMMNTIDNMDNERKKRMKKLTKFGIDIRVIENILNWFDVNNQFFINLAEINNVIYKFEEKLNNGLSYNNELEYLLNNIPQTFTAYKLLSDLQNTQKVNHSFNVTSNQQIYDRFCLLENALRETAMTPKSTNSLWGNLLAKMFSSLLIREQIARSGTSINDRISRAGYSIKCGDLQSGLNELLYLDEDVLYPAQDWLKCAKERLLGINSVKLLKSELLSRSIRIVQNE